MLSSTRIVLTSALALCLISGDVSGQALAPGKVPAAQLRPGVGSPQSPLGHATELAKAVSAQRLNGFVDMHTHPMSHLGFGGLVVYGAPDEQSPMPPTQKYHGYDAFRKECNDGAPELAGNVEGALGFCNAAHGGPGFGTQTYGDANDCGDVIRQGVIGSLEKVYEFKTENTLSADHDHRGYPTFATWPTWSSVSHQQMWWQGIQRAHAGGLRVMVALAVNNSLLAKAVNGLYKADDRESIRYQLSELATFVARHGDFMEVAKSAADLRRIVRANRLAVVLGVESEDLGNFARRTNFEHENVGVADVEAEIQELHDRYGVRYILPMHFSNNAFGGPSIADPLMMLSSRFYTNQYIQTSAECGTSSSRTGLRFMPSPARFEDFLSADLLRSRDLGWVIDHQPAYVRPTSARPGDVCGMHNARGLQPLGTAGLRQMMKLGMLIDIDHMSRRMVSDVLTLAERPENAYPLSSGHNGLLDSRCFGAARFPHDEEVCTEHPRTESEYKRIRKLGGMIGMGHGGSAPAFAAGYKSLLTLVGGRGVAIGTDANGLFPLPKPSPVVYDASFPRYHFGRDWDYNKDGFAHYGMFPDFLRSATTVGAGPERLDGAAKTAFMTSAEDFAQTWEKSEQRARVMSMPASDGQTSITVALEPTGGFCPQGAVRGDAEFGGHGPRVTGTISLVVSTDGGAVLARAALTFSEPGGDSETRASIERTVYRATPGTRIVRLESPTETVVDTTLNGGGRVEPFGGCDGDEHDIALPSGPAKSLRMVGDTGGGDISGDADCSCDTRVLDITFRPAVVRSAPR